MIGGHVSSPAIHSFAGSPVLKPVVESPVSKVVKDVNVSSDTIKHHDINTSFGNHRSIVDYDAGGDNKIIKAMQVSTGRSLEQSGSAIQVPPSPTPAGRISTGRKIREENSFMPPPSPMMAGRHSVRPQPEGERAKDIGSSLKNMSMENSKNIDSPSSLKEKSHSQPINRRVGSQNNIGDLQLPNQLTSSRKTETPTGGNRSYDSEKLKVLETQLSELKQSLQKVKEEKEQLEHVLRVATKLNQVPLEGLIPFLNFSEHTIIPTTTSAVVAQLVVENKYLRTMADRAASAERESHDIKATFERLKEESRSEITSLQNRLLVAEERASSLMDRYKGQIKPTGNFVSSLERSRGAPVSLVPHIEPRSKSPMPARINFSNILTTNLHSLKDEFDQQITNGYTYKDEGRIDTEVRQPWIQSTARSRSAKGRGNRDFIEDESRLNLSAAKSSNFVAKKVFASNDNYRSNDQDHAASGLKHWLGNPDEMDYSILKWEERSALGRADMSHIQKSVTNLNDSSSSLIYAEDERSRIRHRLLDSQRETSYGEQYMNNTQGLYQSRSQQFNGEKISDSGRPTRDRTPTQASSSLTKAESFLADFNRKIAAMNLNS